MSEDTPFYGDRQFVCEVCRQVFVPTLREAEVLAALERELNLDPAKASMICAACDGRSIQ